MYTNTKAMLKNARDGGYAVGAFNVESAEMVEAVIRAAEQASAPVILQTTPGTLRYFPAGMFSAMVRYAAGQVRVPVALHLDHGSGSALAEECLAAGYSSIMIDGSPLPYDENAALTQAVCAAAHKMDVPVEAELGVIGGKEDDTVADGPLYTDPAQAADFVRRTGVDSLAISIGTAHGFYKTAPVLDLERITETRKLVDIPLVLHGASGLPDETVTRAAQLGMCKVNFATELRAAYTGAVRAYLTENPDDIDPKKYGTAARAAVQELVAHKLRVCGAVGKA